MSLPKAAFKYILRRGNESHTQKELEENKKRAYKQTGQDIEKAKKEGRYIRGSRNYKNTKNKMDKSTLKKSEHREKLIDDL